MALIPFLGILVAMTVVGTWPLGFLLIARLHEWPFEKVIRRSEILDGPNKAERYPNDREHDADTLPAVEPELSHWGSCDLSV